MAWAFLSLGAFACLVVGACQVKYIDLLNNREERALRLTIDAENRKSQRTADVVAIAEKANDVEAALLKHEERICALELTAAGAPRPRPR